jgi:hypothetical protein
LTQLEFALHPYREDERQQQTARSVTQLTGEQLAEAKRDSTILALK